MSEFTKITLAGLDFAALSETEVVDRVRAALDRGEGGRIATPNVDILRQAARDPEVRADLDTADLLVADGTPLVWASRLARQPLPERVTGSGLIWSLSAGLALDGRSVYLLGGEPGPVDERYSGAERAAEVLVDRFPGLRIAGHASPPHGFDRDENAFRETLQRVILAEPDLVFVGLGFPKQERIIGLLRPELPATWFLGCGAAINFVAGDQNRAPMWMQRGGLEWVHRLANEPTRLAGRYLCHDAPYALRLLASAALTGREPAAGPEPAPVPASASAPPPAGRADDTPWIDELDERWPVDAAAPEEPPAWTAAEEEPPAWVAVPSSANPVVDVTAEPMPAWADEETVIMPWLPSRTAEYVSSAARNDTVATYLPPEPARGEWGPRPVTGQGPAGGRDAGAERAWMPEPGAEWEPDSGGGTEAEWQPGTEWEPDSGGDAEAEWQPGTEWEPESGGDAEAEWQPEHGGDAEAEWQSGAGWESTVGPERVPESRGEPEPEREAAVGPESKSGVAVGPERVPEARRESGARQESATEWTRAERESAVAAGPAQAAAVRHEVAAEWAPVARADDAWAPEGRREPERSVRRDRGPADEPVARPETAAGREPATSRATSTEPEVGFGRDAASVRGAEREWSSEAGSGWGADPDREVTPGWDADRELRPGRDGTSARRSEREWSAEAGSGWDAESDREMAPGRDGTSARRSEREWSAEAGPGWAPGPDQELTTGREPTPDREVTPGRDGRSARRPEPEWTATDGPTPAREWEPSAQRHPRAAPGPDERAPAARWAPGPPAAPDEDPEARVVAARENVEALAARNETLPRFKVSMSAGFATNDDLASSEAFAPGMGARLRKAPVSGLALPAGAPPPLVPAGPAPRRRAPGERPRPRPRPR